MRLLKVAAPYIPKSVKRWLPVQKLRYFGFKYYCAACESYSSQFLDFDLSSLHVSGGIIPNKVVPNTLCPRCYSHVHHRLMWTVLPNLLAQLKRQNEAHKRILHFAPEPFSIPRLQKLAGVQYIQTDYMRTDIDVMLDMCRLGLVSNSVDLVIASHVLEHVDDDGAALQEIYRVLKPGGKAVILVPLLAQESFELPNVKDPFDRKKYYGQSDHVRAYGLDLQSKIEKYGLEVRVIYAEEFKEFDRNSYLLPIQGRLFLATKPKCAAHA